MTTEIMIVLGILAVMTLMFFTEIIPISFVALAVPVLFQVSGILTAGEAWAGFSNTSIITYMSLFIVGGMLAKTSITYHMKRFAYRYGRGSGARILLICMLSVIVMACLTSGTAGLVVLAPIVEEICKSSGIETKKVLKPCADVGLWGSVQTIPFGSSFTYLAMMNAYIEGAGGTQFYGLFDYTLIKGPMMILLMAYYLFINRNLKAIEAAVDQAGDLDDGTKHTSYTPSQEKLAYTIFVLNIVFMVAAALTGIVPTYLVSCAFAILATALHLLTEKEAFASINWPVIFLVAGTLPISTAMNKTGTGVWIAGIIQDVFPSANNAAILATVFCVISMLTTHFMSNTAVWATFGPVAATMGITLGLDPRLIVSGVACGAIICFATPMANPGQAFVYQKGGYTMKEYLASGIVPCLLMCGFFAVWAPFILNVLYG